MITKPSFECLPSRMVNKMCMRMWGEMSPKRGKPELPVSITLDALEMLAREDDHALDMVPYPYVGMDWRGCPEIFFTPDEPPHERGNINVMFKLLHFILFVLNAN